MALPNGIILVTGPTGSGKTTTLYTALNDLNRPELKLFTVEDPIEYQLSGINQIQVQPQIGLDFPTALRSILRQDPDIVMIGEIRDLETARIAIQAALDRPSGILDLAHQQRDCRDCAPDRYRAGALPSRLDDRGSHGAASGPKALSRLLAAAQRTATGRMASSRWRSAGNPAGRSFAQPASRLAARRAAIPVTAAVRRYRSCWSSMTASAKRLDRRSQDQRAVEQLAREAGFHTLYEDGLLKVGAGETSLEEVLRVTRAS